MGIRIVKPQIGDPCWCHPEPMNTPAIIYLLFDGLIQCPGKAVPPNGHTFLCLQDSINPCKFVDDSTLHDWIVTLTYLCNQNQTQIQLTNDVPQNFFLGIVNGFAPEHTIFDNVYGGCAANQLSYDGVATLFWMDTVQWLIDAMGIPNDGNTFLEAFIKDEAHSVYKFCNVKYSMNQTIQVS